MVILKVTTCKGLSSYKTTSSDFFELCANIANSFLLPSVSCLEATGKKPLAGNAQSGHAILFFFFWIIILYCNRIYYMYWAL
jgi:hypothetical protein